MNVAITGSSGYIAGFLLDSLKMESGVERIIRISSSVGADFYLDLQEAEKFDYSVLENIDIIIFTAAISGPDQCAAQFESCWKINVTGTGYFINEAIKHHCKVLFFSSDAVFGNISGEIYTEESETKAITPYGQMKKAVEDRFREEFGFKAIRLSYVVSKQDRFVSYCLKCIENGDVAEIFHPLYRNCITASQVVTIVQWFIRHWDEYSPSVLNAAGTELVSRVRIADEINRLLGDELRYIISYPGEKFYENRPQITQMKSLYIEKYGILENATFTEKFKKELEMQ